jgi:hypothetical protein
VVFIYKLTLYQLQVTMKNCPEINELLNKIVGDHAIGFFERKASTAYEDVQVFIPVYQNAQSKDLAN